MRATARRTGCWRTSMGESGMDRGKFGFGVLVVVAWSGTSWFMLFWIYIARRDSDHSHSRYWGRNHRHSHIVVPTAWPIVPTARHWSSPSPGNRVYSTGGLSRRCFLPDAERRDAGDRLPDWRLHSPLVWVSLVLCPSLSCLSSLSLPSARPTLQASSLFPLCESPLPLLPPGMPMVLRAV